MNTLTKLILLLILTGFPFATFAQEKERTEDPQEENEVQRDIAQEESYYQKDVPMEEEALLQAPHDMDDNHLLSKSKKIQY